METHPSLAANDKYLALCYLTHNKLSLKVWNKEKKIVTEKVFISRPVDNRFNRPQCAFDNYSNKIYIVYGNPDFYNCEQLALIVFDIDQDDIIEETQIHAGGYIINTVRIDSGFDAPMCAYACWSKKKHYKIEIFDCIKKQKQTIYEGPKEWQINDISQMFVSYRCANEAGMIKNFLDNYAVIIPKPTDDTYTVSEGSMVFKNGILYHAFIVTFRDDKKDHTQYLFTYDIETKQARTLELDAVNYVVKGIDSWARIYVDGEETVFVAFTTNSGKKIKLHKIVDELKDDNKEFESEVAEYSYCDIVGFNGGLWLAYEHYYNIHIDEVWDCATEPTQLKPIYIIEKETEESETKTSIKETIIKAIWNWIRKKLKI